MSNELNEWSIRELLKIISLLRYRMNAWLFNPNIDPDEIIDSIMHSIIAARSLATCFDIAEVMLLSTDTDDLYETFSIAADLLRKVVHSIVPIQQKNIVLTENSDPWLSSEFLAEEVVEMADLYLTVPFDEKIDWVDRFMGEVKLAGSNDIQRIVTQALPGLSLQYCHKNMNFIVDDKKRSYFKINKTGQHWDDVRDTGKICLFISKRFLDLDIQLVAIFENEKYGFAN